MNLNLIGSTILFRFSGYHLNFFEYYNKFFNLSDEPAGTESDVPKEVEIEFRDVWFRYPGTERDILKGLSFRVGKGEKVSIVGENGEGKSTMVKLLLGLFQPDRGEILINGRNLSEYTAEGRSKIFGTVFQDFVRYSISAKENVAVGSIDKLEDQQAFMTAIHRANAEQVFSGLPNGGDTLLGRDFDGGCDLSGGQWQRIAIARAFMGDKPVLILDEPTSQLDPMAEMAHHKTAVFITHRLASTRITDKIYVISGGIASECGTHEELMAQGGLYYTMFEAQKQWYHKKEANPDEG